jgi:hypothetical protein
LELSRQETKAAHEEGQKLQQRLSELAAQEAELRGVIQQYSISGRRWSAIMLAAVALLIGIVLTVLVLLIVTLVSGPK